MRRRCRVAARSSRWTWANRSTSLSSRSASSGCRVGSPDEISRSQIVGTRPGEKLAEEIVDPEEEPLPSGHQGIFVSRPPVPDRPAMRRALRELEELVHAGEADVLARRVKDLAGSPLQPIFVGESR